MQSKHIDTGAGEHHDLSHCSAAVAVNGVAYVISGRQRLCDPRNLTSITTPYIQRLDPTGPVTCHDDDRVTSWIQAAHLDAKIYIYGYRFDDDSADYVEPFFEVFDTGSKTLDRLLLNSDVRDKSSYLRLLGVDSDKNIIFMRFPDHFVFYNTKNNVWGTVPDVETDVQRRIWWSESKRCVVAGKRIYWFTNMKTMMAFDLVECSYYSSEELVKFQGSFGRCDGLELESVILLHLNQNHFCLVSKHVFSRDVFITTLLVSSNAAKKSLTISLINTNRYEADGFHHCLRHALQLTEAVSMPDDTVHIMEETESPDRDPIAAYLPGTGHRFGSEVSLSTWICVIGSCKKGCYVPLT
jgi:hypothetical protein